MNKPWFDQFMRELACGIIRRVLPRLTGGSAPSGSSFPAGRTPYLVPIAAHDNVWHLAGHPEPAKQS